MKYTLPIILVFFLFAACSGGPSGTISSDDAANPSPAPSTFSGEDAPMEDVIVGNLSAKQVEMVTEETLGGIVFRTIEPNILPLKAANVGFTANVSELDEVFNLKAIDGTATVAANGMLETIYSAGATGPVFYFSPLYIDINFDSFVFESPDLGIITINGEINCSFKGRYESPTEKLIGGGSCATSTFEKAGELVVTHQDIDYQIVYSVAFEVYGDPFDISSYTFEGEFTINGIVVSLFRG